MTSRPAQHRRLRRVRRGSTTVEFAIVVPVFMMLILGIVDIGRAFYITSQLDSAARDAVRAASVMNDPSNAASADTVRDVAIGFGGAMGTKPLAKSQIDVVVDNVAKTVTVRIHDDSVAMITPFGRMIGHPSVVLGRSATLPLEHTS